MKALDGFLSGFVSPVLVGAGFRRSRRKYRWVAGDGGMILVQFWAYGFGDAVGFHAGWSAFPSVLREYVAFRAEQWGLSGTWMDQQGLFAARFVVPAEVQGCWVRRCRGCWRG